MIVCLCSPKLNALHVTEACSSAVLIEVMAKLGLSIDSYSLYIISVLYCSIHETNQKKKYWGYGFNLHELIYIDLCARFSDVKEDSNFLLVFIA